MQKRTGRLMMRSPGRPMINQRLINRAFWERISAGFQSDEAERVSGVPQPLGPRWFRQAGGILSTNLGPVSGGYLSFPDAERLPKYMHSNSVSGRLPDNLNARLRPSRASCAAMQQPVAASCSTQPGWRSGRPNVRRTGPRWPRLRSTTGAGPMFKSV